MAARDPLPWAAQVNDNRLPDVLGGGFHATRCHAVADIASKVETVSIGGRSLNATNVNSGMRVTPKAVCLPRARRPIPAQRPSSERPRAGA